MREITLPVSGKSVKVFPLKGGDVRALAAMPKAEDWELLFETLRRAGFKDEELNDFPFPDILEINKALTAETYGIEEEIKN